MGANDLRCCALKPQNIHTLSDGKPLGGKNRLTDGIIQQLLSFYKNAITQNQDCEKKMARAVWASLVLLIFRLITILTTNFAPLEKTHGANTTKQ